MRTLIISFVAATLFLLQPLLVRRKATVVAEDGRPVHETGLTNVTPLGLAAMVGLQLLIAI